MALAAASRLGPYEILSPDNRWLTYMETGWESDIWIAEMKQSHIFSFFPDRIEIRAPIAFVGSIGERTCYSFFVSAGSTSRPENREAK